MEVPSLRGDLRDLIARYLELPYVSESCKDGIRTENRYQPVDLGELDIAGVRSAREGVLDRIDFTGKTVLDLGSNLGELSRGARARGAALVDGFEYDEFFVEVASAVNAYGGVTRVSFEARDITDPGTYRDHYDVVLAFSVFVYVERVMEQIAAITDGIFVLETHRLEDNLLDYYVRDVGRWFGHYAILGESDWDVRLGGAGDRRAVLAFARDEPTLLEALAGPRGEDPPEVVRAAVARPPASSPPARQVEVDLTKPPREALQSRFFMMFRFDSLDELMTAIDRTEIDVDALARSIEIRNLLAEGWVYWFLFVKGYLQYARAGKVEEGNVYFDYLVRHFLAQGHDPAAREPLSDREAAVERVVRRYRDFDLLREAAAASPDPAPPTAPVRITVGDMPREPPLQLYEVGAGEPLPVRQIDGWHRLCSARLSGFRSYPCEAIPEDLHARPIRAAVERFSWDGARFEAEGWCLDPAEPVFNFEVRAGRRIVATGAVAERPDVAAAFGAVAHAGRSGFSLAADVAEPLGDPVRFDLIALQEILPVGVIGLLHLPGVPVGEASLAYQMLRPVARRRALDSLESVVEWEAGGTRMGAAIARLLPGADVIDPATVAGADLVLAHAVTPDRALADELARVVSGTGLVVTSHVGELALALTGEPASAHTREAVRDAFGEVFETLDYLVGAAANLYDVAVLRKR